MAQPLIATARITVPYLVGGLPHRAVAYCKIDELIGARHTLLYRPDSDPSFFDVGAGPQFIKAIAGFLHGAEAEIGSALLEQYISPVWVPVETTETTPTTFEGLYSPGWQTTLVLRDTTFKKVKVIAMEGGRSALAHFGSVGSLPTEYGIAVSPWTVDADDPNDPWYWQVGRSENFLADLGSFVGLTNTSNKKVRRARGLT